MLREMRVKAREAERPAEARDRGKAKKTIPGKCVGGSWKRLVLSGVCMRVWEGPDRVAGARV